MTVARHVVMALLVLGCNRQSSEASQTKAAPSGSAARDVPKKVRLPLQVISDARIKTAPATREVLVGMLDLPGQIAADPDKTARIASPVAGRIEEVSFKEGTLVKKGDALAVVRVPELGKIRSAFASTTAKAKAARSNAERLENLRGQGLSGEQEHLNAEAEAQALEADARALAEQLGAMGMNSGGSGALLTIRAPLAGVVVSRDAVAGQPINPDQTIGTIADLSQVWFLGRVFETNLDQLRLGAKVKVKLDGIPKETFEGTLNYIGKQIDPNTRTLTARVQIANPNDTLRIGLYGTAHVLAGDDTQKPPSVVLPRTAVIDVGGKPVVFVALGNGEFELHEVVVGEGALDRIEIKSGVSEGQEVVVDGGFTLKSAFLKSTFAEGE